MTKNDPNRADQILGCAQELFFLRGYENTSLADIVSAAGVTKGAFYHHFSSKADILEQLLERLVSRFRTNLEVTAAGSDRTPLQAYQEFFKIVRNEFEFPSQQANPELGRALYLEENDSIRNKLFQRISEVAISVLTGILQRGVAGTPLSPADATASAELVVQISLAHQRALKRLRYSGSQDETTSHVGQLHLLIRQQGIAVDRLLGLPDGTTSIRSDKALDSLPKLGFQPPKD